MSDARFTVQLRHEDIGVTRYCPRCDEWWPLDAEFWYVIAPRKRAPWREYRCKGCTSHGWTAWRERRTA